jgi:hypothetical protein
MERDGWRLKLLCYCRITKAKHKFRGLEIVRFEMVDGRVEKFNQISF